MISPANPASCRPIPESVPASIQSMLWKTTPLRRHKDHVAHFRWFSAVQVLTLISLRASPGVGMSFPDTYLCQPGGCLRYTKTSCCLCNTRANTTHACLINYPKINAHQTAQRLRATCKLTQPGAEGGQTASKQWLQAFSTASGVP